MKQLITKKEKHKKEKKTQNKMSLIKFEKKMTIHFGIIKSWSW